ncbi:adenylate kinase 7-like [Sipha flava]|uniref:Adenylate kinase 7-like n=1 Tax=Sipha flava TaxID=143950 RepID=A0A8B8FSF4_9HEMI|nr:adenylate kinase 7-like [Sipha flava]
MTWVKKNNHQTGEEQESDFVTTQENIFKTYIIGTGITYGHEESAFHHVFKSALINPKEIFISILNHRVPMFHIDELAKLVFIISKYDDRVRGNYVLAIEQKSYGFNNIIKSLCNESCSSHLVLKEDHLIIRKYKFDDFTWDLICSDLIIDPMLDIIIPDYHIRRTSIVSNMKESISEFVEANNFYLIKLIVSGQVQHVVNDIAKILAQYYQIKKYSSTEKIMEDSNQTFAVRETSGISIKTKSTELEYTDYFQEELTTGKMTDLQYNHYMNSITTQIGHTHNKIDLQEIIKNLRQKTITNTLKKSNTIFNKLKIMKEQWENNIIANQKSKEKQENRMSVNTRTYLRLNFLPVLMKEICLIDNGAI